MCQISGELVRTKSTRKNAREKGRICFPEIGPFDMKNDEDLARNISNVPLDYMHLILLGVTKRLIRLCLTGPLKVRLGAVAVNKISQKLLTLGYCTLR